MISVKDQVWFRMRINTWYDSEYQISKQVMNEIWEGIRDHLDNIVHFQVRNQIKQQVRDQSR